jgi:hypothetical protein
MRGLAPFCAVGLRVKAGSYEGRVSLAAKTKTPRGWGTGGSGDPHGQPAGKPALLSRLWVLWGGIVASHACGKDKGAARMGHPAGQETRTDSRLVSRRYSRPGSSTWHPAAGADFWQIAGTRREFSGGFRFKRIWAATQR